MKVQFIIPLALLTSIALVGVMKVRKREHEKEERRKKFQDIKLRVTNDVLGEYQSAVAESHNMLEKTESQQKTLEKEMANLQVNEDRIKKESDLCQEGKKSDADKLAVMTMDLDNLKAESEKEMTFWNTEIAGLKKQLAGRSPVCDFLKEGMSNLRLICGDKEPNKAIEEKAEAPKKEGEKAEVSKKEDEKAEAPKKDDEKAEAPKKDDEKAEAPKKEEEKAEAPKKEEEKAEVPKQEQPKAEAKVEGEVKAEAKAEAQR